MVLVDFVSYCLMYQNVNNTAVVSSVKLNKLNCIEQVNRYNCMEYTISHICFEYFSVYTFCRLFLPVKPMRKYQSDQYNFLG